MPQNGCNTLNTNLTTDEMDKTTPEERRKLVGFCDRDQEWYKFVDDPENPDSRKCPDCGGIPSTRIGFQLTTQRTFDPKAKKMTKAQIKKMMSDGT